MSVYVNVWTMWRVCVYVSVWTMWLVCVSRLRWNVWIAAFQRAQLDPRGVMSACELCECCGLRAQSGLCGRVALHNLGSMSSVLLNVDSVLPQERKHFKSPNLVYLVWLV